MGLSYDLVFVGDVCIGDIHPFGGKPYSFYGGPGLFCAMAAGWSSKDIALVTRLAEGDAGSLDQLKKSSIAVHATFTPQTCRNRIDHPSADIDERRMTLLETNGWFAPEDLPDLAPTSLHLAGLNDRDFTVETMTRLREKGFTLSTDMQSFVCQVEPDTGEVVMADVPAKREIATLLRSVKLDAKEAELLTGTGDLEQAAIQFERWGTSEIMITRADGALVRHGGRSYFERFSSRGTQGRTGRGDTTFGAYLARRLESEVADSLRFAVALASIKIETPGPFVGTLREVLDRLEDGRQE